MDEKKEAQNKKPKLQDLPPKKDAKGGLGARQQGQVTAGGGARQSAGHRAQGGHSAQSRMWDDGG